MKNRISELRKKNNITQEELAKQVGVIRQTISALENYKHFPSLKLAYKIARYFNKSIEDIFTFEVENGKEI